MYTRTRTHTSLTLDASQFLALHARVQTAIGGVQGVEAGPAQRQLAKFTHLALVPRVAARLTADQLEARFAVGETVTKHRAACGNGRCFNHPLRTIAGLKMILHKLFLSATAYSSLWTFIAETHEA